MDSISRYLLLLASLLLSAACGTAGRLADAGTAAGDSTVVTIFYDNDVHCNIDGYDVLTLGNHEFDYGMQRLGELSDSLDAVISVCNLYERGKAAPMYEPYVIKEFGPVKVAFVGITTPYSFMSSTPSYFQDERGNYI